MSKDLSKKNSYRIEDQVNTNHNHQSIQITISNTSDSEQNNPNKINWQDFNYPPCLNLFHFNITEINELEWKRVCNLSRISMLLLFATQCINLINAVILFFCHFQTFLIIIYSLLQLFIQSPLELYIFYQSFKSIASQSAPLICNYCWLQFLCGLFYFIFSIISTGSFNGFTKLSTLIEEDLIFSFLLALVESLAYLVNSLLSLFIIYKIKRIFQQQNEHQEPDQQQKNHNNEYLQSQYNLTPFKYDSSPIYGKQQCKIQSESKTIVATDQKRELQGIEQLDTQNTNSKEVFGSPQYKVQYQNIKEHLHKKKKAESNTLSKQKKEEEVLLKHFDQKNYHQRVNKEGELLSIKRNPSEFEEANQN